MKIAKKPIKKSTAKGPSTEPKKGMKPLSQKDAKNVKNRLLDDTHEDDDDDFAFSFDNDADDGELEADEADDEDRLH